MEKVTLFATLLVMTSAALVQARSNGDYRNSQYMSGFAKYTEQVGFTLVGRYRKHVTWPPHEAREPA